MRTSGHLFDGWLNYINKWPRTDYDLNENEYKSNTAEPAHASAAETESCWYATDLVLLSTLIYRGTRLQRHQYPVSWCYVRRYAGLISPGR